MARIIILKHDVGLAWGETAWGEDIDSDEPSESKRRALEILAELDVGLGKDVARYRAHCTDMEDAASFFVDARDADYAEIRQAEVEAERERAAEHRAELRMGR